MADLDPIIVALRAERRRLKLSQTAVGELLGRSTYNTVWQWENGTNDPTLTNVRAWAAALGQELMLGQEVFGFWNYRGPWTPESTAQMIPIATSDAASLRGVRNYLYRAYRTPWQPVGESGTTRHG